MTVVAQQECALYEGRGVRWDSGTQKRAGSGWRWSDRRVVAWSLRSQRVPRWSEFATEHTDVGGSLGQESRGTGKQAGFQCRRLRNVPGSAQRPGTLPKTHRVSLQHGWIKHSLLNNTPAPSVSTPKHTSEKMHSGHQPISYLYSRGQDG